VSDDAAKAVQDALADVDPDDLVEPSTATRIAAPLIALGATWLVREILERGYVRATGNQPPHASDPSQRMSRIILWAAATAAAVAVVNVVIDRISAPHLPPE
jgi:Protein of unknown function (DUF4235)